MRAVNSMSTLTATVALGLLCVSQLGAQNAEGWRLSYGLSYRSLSDIDLEPVDVMNGQHPESDYANFAVSPANPSDYHILNASQVVDLPAPAFGGSLYQVDADRATWNGTCEDDGSIGAVLEAERILQQQGPGRTSLCLSLGYFGFDASAGAAAGPGNTSGFSVNHDLFNVWTSVPTNPPVPPDGLGTLFSTNDGFGTPSSDPVAANVAGLSNAGLSVRTSTELYVLVLGVGGQYVYSRGGWDFAVGGGPSLSIAMLDSDYWQRVTTGATVRTTGDSDDTTDAILGLYATLGIEKSITETMSVAATYRYDYVADSVETDYVDVDLSGHSLQLKVTWRF